MFRYKGFNLNVCKRKLGFQSKSFWQLTFLGQLSSFIRWICGLSSFGFVTCGFVGVVRKGEEGREGEGWGVFNSSFPHSVRAGPQISEGYAWDEFNLWISICIGCSYWHPIVGVYKELQAPTLTANYFWLHALFEISHTMCLNHSKHGHNSSLTWSLIILQSERVVYCGEFTTLGRPIWRLRHLPPRAQPSAPSLCRLQYILIAFSSKFSMNIITLSTKRLVNEQKIFWNWMILYDNHLLEFQKHIIASMLVSQ